MLGDVHSYLPESCVLEDGAPTACLAAWPVVYVVYEEVCPVSISPSLHLAGSSSVSTVGSPVR